MKTWHIFDFPDTIYISLNNNFRKEFFDDIFSELGGIRPSARFFGLSQMTIKQYYREYSYKNKIKHPQAIPISFIKKSLPIINDNLKEKLEQNVYALKAKNRGIPVFNPKLPFIESPAFYRVVAHMIGDGSAPGNKVPYYANTCKELIAQFKKDLEIFGEVKSYEGKLTVPIISFPKVITDILSYLLDVKFSNPDRIPKQIFNASDECKSSFLQALFDDEGYISTTLAISMANKNLVEEIKGLVESLSLETNLISIKKHEHLRDNFTFAIKSSNFIKFREKIGFSHPNKIKNLNFAINTRNRKQRTRDFDELEKLILKNLSNQSISTLEIANNLQLTLGHTLKILKLMEEQNKIIRSGFKNKIIWDLPKV